MDEALSKKDEGEWRFKDSARRRLETSEASPGRHQRKPSSSPPRRSLVLRALADGPASARGAPRPRSPRPDRTRAGANAATSEQPAMCARPLERKPSHNPQIFSLSIKERGRLMRQAVKGVTPSNAGQLKILLEETRRSLPTQYRELLDRERPALAFPGWPARPGAPISATAWADEQEDSASASEKNGEAQIRSRRTASAPRGAGVPRPPRPPCIRPATGKTDTLSGLPEGAALRIPRSAFAFDPRFRVRKASPVKDVPSRQLVVDMVGGRSAGRGLAGAAPLLVTSDGRKMQTAR